MRKVVVSAVANNREVTPFHEARCQMLATPLAMAEFRKPESEDAQGSVWSALFMALRLVVAGGWGGDCHIPFRFKLHAARSACAAVQKISRRVFRWTGQTGGPK